MRSQRVAHQSASRAATFVVFTSCLSAWVWGGDGPLANRPILRFDFGPAESVVAQNAIRVDLDSRYPSPQGFGWTQPPERGFIRSDLARSRGTSAIDGVTGSSIEFRADVARGRWYVTLWLEVGPWEKEWPKIVVQDRPQSLDWQSFRPPAEPSQSPPRLYRVFQCEADVADDGLQVRVSGPAAKVKLLACSLIKKIGEPGERFQRDFQQFEKAYFEDGIVRSELLPRTVELARDHPSDPCYAWWLQQVQLLAEAERYYEMRGWEWAKHETGLGMFDRQHQAVMLLDGILARPGTNMSILSERGLFLRGQLLYWLGRQRGGVAEIAGGRRDLSRLAVKYPHDRLLAMYLGQPIDTPDPCDQMRSVATAPQWSVAQHEALCRLRQIAHWWVEHRQSDTGEFGGKWGDDVELLRWWAPICLAGDETALKGWQRLADGVWRSDHIEGGYARKLADVEHAAEFVADTAPLMVIYHDDPRYAQRLKQSAELFESLWTGKTSRGHRFFRSAWFSATSVATDKSLACDVEYNSRAVQALRYLARRNPDPQLIELLQEWSLAWVQAAMRTDKGKPSGIIPASVRFSDEAFNGDGPNWYQANLRWDYYEWEHYAGSLILDQLLFTHVLTQDPRLLQPMFKTLELIEAEADGGRASREDHEKCSTAWAAAVLRQCEPFWHVVEQWRFMTQDPRWDRLIMQHGSAYGRYRVSGEAKHLTDGLTRILNDVRFNTPLKTTAALYTDRVDIQAWECLKAMLTGDGIPDNWSPYHWVTWEQTDPHFTALVNDTGPRNLSIELFSHAPRDRQVVMRLWQPSPGTYELRCSTSDRGCRTERVDLKGAGQRIRLTLPSRRLLRVNLQPCGSAGGRLGGQQ